MRIPVALAWLPLTVLAQGYSQLATNVRGDKIAFVSAQPRLDDEPSRERLRLYRRDGDGEVALVSDSPGTQVNCRFGSVAVAAPVFVPDSDELIHHEATLCSGLFPPVPPELTYEVRGMSFPVAGRAQFSADGRYAAVQPKDAAWLLDRRTGDAITLPRGEERRRLLLGSPHHAVSDEGQVVLLDDVYPPIQFGNNGRAALWEKGTVRALPLNGVRGCQIDPRGRYVICGQPNGLVALDLATGTQRLLDGGLAPTARISADGSRVLVMSGSARQSLFILSMPDGAMTHQLLPDVTTAALSGDGRVAFAQERGGSLWRFDLETGAKTEVLGPAPSLIVYGPSRVTPGSLVTFMGDLAEASAREAEGEQLPRALAGYRVLLNGEPAPVFKVGPRELRFQVPWEASGALRIEVRHERNNAFLAALWRGEVEPMPVIRWEVSPEATTLGATIAAHEDFRGLVTRADPASPGELVHLYATGLGAVATGFASTGVRTPLGAHPVVTPITCARQGRPLEVVYAGLAGTLVGLYQVSVRLPAELSAGHFEFACRTMTEQVTADVATIPVSGN